MGNLTICFCEIPENLENYLTNSETDSRKPENFLQKMNKSTTFRKKLSAIRENVSEFAKYFQFFAKLFLFLLTTKNNLFYFQKLFCNLHV